MILGRNSVSPNTDSYPMDAPRFVGPGSAIPQELNRGSLLFKTPAGGI
jgi:hypothetical protein